jgi:hypothetical protein
MRGMPGPERQPACEPPKAEQAFWPASFPADLVANTWCGSAQVLGRTISMQFDGNWTPVEDIVIDKLGKYAYAIPGISGGPATPFILDVALDVRAKVGSNIFLNSLV